MLPKVGVVGLNHGYSIAQAIAASKTIELTALCTPNPSMHQEKAARLNVPLFDHLDTMLDEIKLDGVVIAAPTGQLVPLAKRCLERNVSVLVEKPAGVNVSDALALKAVAEKTQHPVVVGYYRRLSRQFLTLQALLASRAIGNVMGVSFKWVVEKPLGYFKGWKASTALGGGCLMINVIHDLDMLQQLLGPIEAVAAMKSCDDLANDIEHFVTVTMRFRSGVLGTGIIADRSPSPFSYDNTVAAVSQFPRYPVDSHHFFGTAGSLAFPSFNRYSSEGAPAGWRTPLSVSVVSDTNDSVDDPITRQIDRFADVIRARLEPHATMDDAVRNLAVVEAIRRSLALSTIEPVTIEPANVVYS